MRSLEEFLNQYDVTDSFKELVKARQANGMAYHQERGSTWEGWKGDRFVEEAVKEALDLPVWLWKAVEHVPQLIPFIPDLIEQCSTFTIGCECLGYDDCVERASEYP